ncbi:MAG TPA: alpha/beta hydrolase [Steroidobacteraceae bacterium]|jgi:esterase/lipase superfamily enzyme|nr:alpha/beta hydrolase [Steroidobacteraceae bacterium]
MRTSAMLWVAVLALGSAAASAQTNAQLRAYQDFENAKAAGQTAAALDFGKQAIALTEGGDSAELIELSRNVGDFAAQAGSDELARGYYLKALHLQEAALGPNHPDLVPVLSALAELAMKDKRYADAESQLTRILSIEQAAYGERHANTLASLAKLRALYQVTNDAPGISRVDAQLQPPPAATRGSLPRPGEAAGKERRYKQNELGFATVRVFYGTNRARTGALKPSQFYGKARGELEYGYLDVTIPRIHQEAQLETEPKWVEYTFMADPAALRAQYVLLDKVTPLEMREFTRALHQQISESRFKDVFIFVHGFNNTFEEAARRAAQMAYDLDFDGTPMLYSWPSQGSATAYAIDEAAVGISGRRLSDFLETVVAQSGAQRIHLIAHSMGNRALIEALQTYLAKRAPDNRQHIFGQIVFTAPDVDRDYFTDAIQSLSGAAERITLYASDNDYALRSSQFLHGAPRAGTAGDIILKLAGVDSIDMSSVPADSLGHSYFAANSGAIYDMFRLLWRGDPPPQRCGMSNRKAAGTFTVWWFDAEACKGADMLEAGVMLKRFGELARQHVLSNISALTDPSQQREWKLVLTRLDGLLPKSTQPKGSVPK